MKIIIVGNDGPIESCLISLLNREGHEVVFESGQSGADSAIEQNLAGVVAGASVVVDVRDRRSFEDAAAVTSFLACTRQLLAAEAHAGVAHHVMLSVVGAADAHDGGYFRVRSAQESLVVESALPYSILRVTPCFEILDAVADAATVGLVVRIPSARIQPIAAGDVARALARLTTGGPRNGTLELGGPESFYLDGLIGRILGARRDPRSVISDRHAQYFGAAIGDRSLIAGDEADLGEIRFEQWLACAARNGSAPTGAAARACSQSGSRPELGAYEFRVDDVAPG